MSRNNNFITIAQKVIKAMEDPEWLKDADVFEYLATELKPPVAFVLPEQEENP